MQFGNGFNDLKMRIKLVPVGVQIPPTTFMELVTAIKQISSCINQLHELSYCHCDIRWSNIIQCYDKWYLIDSEFACHVDEKVLLCDPSTRIKQRYVLNSSQSWSIIFDWFQVGRLLENESVVAITRASRELTLF